MVVVADTTPINYLLLVGEIRLLPALYGIIIVPRAVANELRDVDAPEIVKVWMAAPPGWLHEHILSAPPRPEIPDLDSGESEAIELALKLKSSLVLLDEAKGRAAAINLNLQVRGTVGILIEAAVAGLVDLEASLDKLEATNFHMTPALRKQAVRSAKGHQ